jgi:hypothetical protein
VCVSVGSVASKSDKREGEREEREKEREGEVRAIRVIVTFVRHNELVHSSRTKRGSNRVSDSQASVDV